MLELSSLIGQFNIPQNRLYATRDALLQQKTRFTDLISGNVTAQGIQFPSPLLHTSFQKAIKATQTYRPDPLGNIQARQAIERWYREEGVRLSADHMVLTPGTSFSYLYAFKILANPGDEFLVPTPSYPLFDSIAELCKVKLVPYRLRESARWEIDFAQMEDQITPRTKGVILISPHNPTGSVATRNEVAELSRLAAHHQLAILSDEVFSPFVYTGTPLPRPAHTSCPLVITLNGFSKMLALPGIKLGWMALSGDPTLVRQSLKALEMISDTFLPVSEVTQAAAGTLLNQSRAFQTAYVSEMKKRRDLAAQMLKMTPVEGGFFMTLPLKGHDDEESWVCRLLEKERILVHPGYFYEMSGTHVVLSFASRAATLRQALQKIISVR